MRVVIDTNLFVSALINQNSRQRLNLVLEKMAIQILSDDALMDEVYEVINRPKFKKYVSQSEIDDFYKLIQERTIRIETHSIVLVSPDPKDDFLLVICLDGNADYLLTGNKIDLLDLVQFHKTKIITLTEFLTTILPTL
ncbi:MAG: hypothetical protein RLZZ306_3523 [Bacteroidota bacterium]|jgi:putative PIN family toxin of toxin-antitoxin system